MAEFPCQVIGSAIFTAYGDQLKKKSPWFPQELSTEWTHRQRASALTLGESHVSKYGLSFPVRTGLSPRDNALDFLEKTSFLPMDDPLSLNHKTVEELYLSRGVCVISHGPLGGPSFLKGLYRPLVSYGTGVGVSQVIKAKFPNQTAWMDEAAETTDESFICLAERGGISMYAENSSETHVSHVPEFQIDRILPCKFGLLVIPSRVKKESLIDYYKNIFILTHPIKQVSKIWIRSRPGHDYCEYDGLDERLLWCEDDLCIFWSLKNDKIFIRRLVALDKNEVLQLSTLNASMYQTSPEVSSKYMHPSTSMSHFHSNSPFSKQPFTRSVAMKANREVASSTYWPSFDFTQNTSSNNSMGHGFYPPHVCIYDDPELYLKPLFQIDLPKTSWKEPRKFKLLRDSPTKIALWYLIKNNLHAYGVDIDSGTKLGSYVMKNIQDFTVPAGPERLPVVIVLDTSGNLRLSWLDGNYNHVCSSILNFSSEVLSSPKFTITSVETMLFGDTIICTIAKPPAKDTSEKKTHPDPIEYVKLHLKNYKDNCLVRNTMECLSANFDTRLMTNLIARLTAGNIKIKQNISPRSFDSDEMDVDIYPSSLTHAGFADSWLDFVGAIQDVILMEPANEQLLLGKSLLNAVAAFRETSSISTYHADVKLELNYLLKELIDFLRSKFPKEKLDGVVPILSTFGYLLLQPDPKSDEAFETLPEVMQILLDCPDSPDNIERLVDIQRTEKFIPVIELLICDVYHRNSSVMQFDAPIKVLSATRRSDYLSGRKTPPRASTRQDWVDDKNEAISPFVDDLDEDSAWMSTLLTMKIFTDDRRLEEVCRLLDSTHAIYVDTEQRAEMSDHEFVEEQEKTLMQQIQIAFAAPVGRTALTLRTDDSVYTSLTDAITIPLLNFAGKCKGKGTTIELSENDLPPVYTNWPHFHNAVSAALSVRFTRPPADAWFAFNKAKHTDGTEQAGMVLGFGLNRILTVMPPTLRHDYLSKENSFTTMAMLLGTSASLAGTGDMATWKVISLHIGAMLPAFTTELEIPRLATLVAPCALGLLFLGTQNTHVAKVLLGEISKKFAPLSCFGSSSNNNSTSVVNPNENTGTTTDREAHSLCAGLGLGFVNLGKGKVNTSGFADDDFDGILRRFVVGGPKPVQTQKDDEERQNIQTEQTLPSMWEEYRCCHIEEGDNVNVDVTTPSAITAVALTYLRTGNEAVLNWLAPPGTLHLLDGIRPDLLMLRSLASILVAEKLVCPKVEWLESFLLPKTLAENALKEPVEFSRLNHESVNQSWASIVTGYCLGLGIRYAGTSDKVVRDSIQHYIDLFFKFSSKESKLSEFFPKNFLDSCICNLVMASSLVVAGTGDLTILRMCRYLQKKISLTTSTVSNNTYGLEMCIAMATGILFLGGGRYSLSNDDKSIAMLLASVFPKWPINSNDNRYHLQALRHLYILAAQPRLILPKPMPQGASVVFQIEFLDGSSTLAPAPVLLPPFYLIKKIRMEHDEFFPIEFNLPHDLPYLTRICENKGELELVHKPIGFANYGFVREMSWRQNTNFHPTFEIDELTPPDEQKKIQEVNLIYQLAEWSGMKQIVPALLTLRNADQTEESDWQIRILHWWTLASAGKMPSCFPKDLLLLLCEHNGRQVDVSELKSLPQLRPISV